MRTLDETDLEILRLLLEDARRPYSDIAERVDRSPPTVSDRIERLQELGVIERFTVVVDQSKLSRGTELLLDLTLRPHAADGVVDALADVDRIEHVFRTAEARVIATATADPTAIRSLLDAHIDVTLVDELSIHVLDRVEWNPDVAGADLALRCDECGNPVTSSGETLQRDGRRHHFCCSSCLSNFEERYAQLTA